MTKHKSKHRRKKLRKLLYNIALTAYRDEQIDDLNEKIVKRDMVIPNVNLSPCETPAHWHMQHGALLSNKISPHMRVHKRNIIFNAVATDCRRNRATPLPPRGPANNPLPCYLCHTEPDTSAHIHGECRASRAARKLFSLSIGITIGDNPSHYGLTYPIGNARPSQKHECARRSNATVILNWCIWHVRTTYCTTLTTHPSILAVANRIANTARSHWNTLMTPSWCTKHDHTPPDPAILDSSRFGSAGTRTPAQTKAAVTYAHTIINNITPTAYIAYTDGASKGNSTKRRSPCGAGALLQLPTTHHEHRQEMEDWAALGSGSNNMGEAWAVGMALLLFEKHATTRSHLFILTDSKITTLAIEHNAPIDPR